MESQGHDRDTRDLGERKGIIVTAISSRFVCVDCGIIFLPWEARSHCSLPAAGSILQLVSEALVSATYTIETIECMALEVCIGNAHGRVDQAALSSGKMAKSSPYHL